MSEDKESSDCGCFIWIIIFIILVNMCTRINDLEDKLETQKTEIINQK
jgi:hypothetical protein